MGEDPGQQSNASKFIPAKLLSYMARIEFGLAKASGTISTVSIERGARELALRPPGNLALGVKVPTPALI